MCFVGPDVLEDERNALTQLVFRSESPVVITIHEQLTKRVPASPTVDRLAAMFLDDFSPRSSDSEVPVKAGKNIVCCKQTY